jgi:hypothetical protein
MGSRVRFQVLLWGFFLEWEDPLGDHDLGSLVEFRFKAPPVKLLTALLTKWSRVFCKTPKVAGFQVSAAVYMRYSLFCDVTQSILVVIYVSGQLRVKQSEIA